jgi:predicted DCC family thiol-disulfide oxidoreductase YuxK
MSHIVVFDAQCLLCNGWVQLLLKRDRKGVFRYASIQGQTGQRLLAQAGLGVEGLQTLLLVQEDGTTWQHTAAIIRVLHYLALALALGLGCRHRAGAIARCAISAGGEKSVSVVWQV